MLITKKGILKLADFGLARAFSVERNGKPNRYTNIYLLNSVFTNFHFVDKLTYCIFPFTLITTFEFSLTKHITHLRILLSSNKNVLMNRSNPFIRA